MRSVGLIFLLVVLGFPALEIYTMLQLADIMGWWLLAWLIFGVIVGRMLIRGEAMAMVGRMAANMSDGQSLFAALWKSGRTMLAGVLFIFPGILSDVIAVILLLWPGRAAKSVNGNAPDDNVVEGEVIVVEADRIEIHTDRR